MFHMCNGTFFDAPREYIIHTQGAHRAEQSIEHGKCNCEAALVRCGVELMHVQEYQITQQINKGDHASELLRFRVSSQKGILRQDPHETLGKV